MYQNTITLFNRKAGERGQGDVWYPTVLHGVNLNVDRAAILEKYGAEAQDSAMLHVRFSRSNGEILVGGKPWMEPKAWDKTVDSLTFTGGTAFDFFWKGEWTGGIAQDADYGDEDFYTYMNRTYDNVFAVSSVAMYSVIPHFEILGK